MKKHKLLVLTDHQTHSAENSIYELLRSLHWHPDCALLHVASRGNAVNTGFFQQQIRQALWVSEVDDQFQYTHDGRAFTEELLVTNLDRYDAIFLRLPPPVSDAFWHFLQSQFPADLIVNRPSGIRVSSRKDYLLNFPELCPHMEFCASLEDIERMWGKYPIVLKPMQGYGGNGILRVDSGRVLSSDLEISFDDFAAAYHNNPTPYLGMRFLRRVSDGDKRVIVCNGELIGASLRVPSQGSWLCNAAQGGLSLTAQPDATERHIAKVLSQELLPLGIIIFGFDTLVDDDGQRVLSEINTMSIGGLKQMQEQSGLPLADRTAALLWDYIN